MRRFKRECRALEIFFGALLLFIERACGRLKTYDGKKEARLGTKKNPAVVTVQTEKRRKEVAATFEQRGWAFRIDLKPDKSEDISALEALLNPPKTVVAERKIGRNELCPCGSGQKHKRCCGR